MGETDVEVLAARGFTIFGDFNLLEEYQKLQAVNGFALDLEQGGKLLADFLRSLPDLDPNKDNIDPDSTIRGKVLATYDPTTITLNDATSQACLSMLSGLASLMDHHHLTNPVLNIRKPGRIVISLNKDTVG